MLSQSLPLIICISSKNAKIPNSEKRRHSFLVLHLVYTISKVNCKQTLTWSFSLIGNLHLLFCWIFQPNHFATLHFRFFHPVQFLNNTLLYLKLFSQAYRSHFWTLIARDSHNIEVELTLSTACLQPPTVHTIRGTLPDLLAFGSFSLFSMVSFLFFGIAHYCPCLCCSGLALACTASTLQIANASLSRFTSLFLLPASTSWANTHLIFYILNFNQFGNRPCLLAVHCLT